MTTQKTSSAPIFLEFLERKILQIISFTSKYHSFRILSITDSKEFLKVLTYLSHMSFTLRMALNQQSLNEETDCGLASCRLKNRKLCLRSRVVYQVKCNTCSKIYVGSTIRPLHIRIKEHLYQKASIILNIINFALQMISSLLLLTS